MYASLAKQEHSKLEKQSAKHKKANVADSESDDEMSVSIISTQKKWIKSLARNRTTQVWLQERKIIRSIFIGWKTMVIQPDMKIKAQGQDPLVMNLPPTDWYLWNQYTVVLHVMKVLVSQQHYLDLTKRQRLSN
jgi:hypothetical protein